MHSTYLDVHDVLAQPGEHHRPTEGMFHLSIVIDTCGAAGGKPCISDCVRVKVSCEIIYVTITCTTLAFD